MTERPAVNLDAVLAAAVEGAASDVILTAGAPPMVRVDGSIVPLSAPPLTPDAVRGLVYGLLTEDQQARFERDRELDFSFTFRGRQRLRGNAMMQRGTMAAAFRLIPVRVPSLEELQLPPVLRDLALIAQGLILVTGPTGHGKSTTQAAMIDIINQNRRAHIVTIEDPIEFVHANRLSVLEQREVGADTLSFASGLRHVLRQAPDVILVGEMRDLESIATVLTAAETGHLVISTLHTNDGVQAIDRIIDAFPPHQQSQVRNQLALSLQAVIAQRLLPRADGRGRVPAVEILRNNYAVSNNIRESKTHQLYSVIDTHAKEGMRSLDRAIRELHHRGLVSYAEAKRRMRNPQMLKS